MFLNNVNTYNTKNLASISLLLQDLQIFSQYVWTRFSQVEISAGQLFHEP